MFLAAAPYFQRRFRTSQSLLSNFQATEVSVSTLANLSTMIILTKLQANASYPRRIILSLGTLTGAFALLALSTKVFTAVSASAYFGFFVVMVLICSAAVGFMQNGTFSYVSSYGRQDYMQGIMTGQAVAGVLPPLVQIVSVLSTGETEGLDEQGKDTSTSALAYFVTATGVSAVTLLAFLYLLRNHRSGHGTTVANDPSDNSVDETAPLTDDGQSSLGQSFKGNDVSLYLIARKLCFSAAAVFITFGVTMVFPVFTQEISSTDPSASPLLHKAAFIPFAFLVWNLGDLIGRLIPLAPHCSLASRPKILLALAILRVVFIPLYLLCNITNTARTSAHLGPVLPDAFYLIVVQFPFGLSNGYLGSCCMMGAPSQVDETEREAAGGFMGLALVGGLAVGSLCSFFIGNL